MNTSKEFHYWKKPWHSWAVLGGALLQIIGLYLKLREYGAISRPEIRNGLFSPSAWESYAAEQHFQFSVGIGVICLFLGCFVIGIFARSKKTADRAMAALFLLFTVFWCGVGFAIPVFSKGSMGVTWFLILIASLCGGIHAVGSIRRR